MTEKEKKVDEMGVGGIAGFQAPMGVKARKSKVDELLSRNPDIGHGNMLLFLRGINEAECKLFEMRLDAGNLIAAADQVREGAIREVVRSKVKEVVRKKPGGGGYALYSPNPKKKGKPKAVGSFPTKLGAKRAELARFPPKDAGKLARARASVDKLAKDPKKRQHAEKQADKQKTKPKADESVNLLRSVVGLMIAESLFREERTGSEWDNHISRMPKQAIAGDKKFQNFQKNIEKRTAGVLEDAFKTIAKAVKKKVKLKNFGLKKSSEGKSYLAFGATLGGVNVEPIYIYVEAGIPKIEMSEASKGALTKADRDQAKAFRAELVTVQEHVLDDVDDLVKAIENRDKYLSKLEVETDKIVGGMSPLQRALLKKVLVQKYKKSA